MLTPRRTGMFPGVILAALTAWGGNLSSGGPVLGAPCLARESRRIAAFALPTDKFSEKAASVLNRLARENLKRTPEFELVDIRAQLEGEGDDPRVRQLEKADRMLERGKDQYDNLELDAAIDELNRAVESYRKAAGRLGSGERYLEALLYLGAAYILSGDNERGVESFRVVAMYDKRATLDPKVFPPSMIELFNQVREEVSSSPVGTVMVKSTPPAAEVFLSGVFKGISPVTLINVPEGAHFIRVEKDGYLPWGQRVDFYATHEETAMATLQKAPGFDQFADKSKDLTTELEEEKPKAKVIQFGEWMRVDRLVLVAVTQRGDEIGASAAMIQVQPPKTLAYRSATFNFTSTSFLSRADAFFTSLYRDVKLPTSEDVAKKPPPAAVVSARCNSDSDCSSEEICDRASGRCIPYAPEGEKFYEKWWFWTIVGGGLLVAGGTTLLVWYLVQPDEGTIEFTF